MEKMTFRSMRSIIFDFFSEYRPQIESEEVSVTESFKEYSKDKLSEIQENDFVKLLGLLYYSNYLWLIEESNYSSKDSSINFNKITEYEDMAVFMDESDVDDFVSLVFVNDGILNDFLENAINSEVGYHKYISSALKTKRGRKIYLKFHPELGEELKEFKSWHDEETKIMALKNVPVNSCGAFYYLMMMCKGMELKRDDLLDILSFIIEEMDENHQDLQIEIISYIATHFYAITKMKQKKNLILSDKEELISNEFQKMNRNAIIELILFEENYRGIVLDIVLQYYNVSTFESDILSVKEETHQFSKKMQIKKPVTE